MDPDLHAGAWGSDPHRLFGPIADATRPVGVAELTDIAHLNHNAVRQHLGVRRAMGLVVDEVEIRYRPSRLRLAFRNTTADNAIRG